MALKFVSWNKTNMIMMRQNMKDWKGKRPCKDNWIFHRLWTKTPWLLGLILKYCLWMANLSSISWRTSAWAKTNMKRRKKKIKVCLTKESFAWLVQTFQLCYKLKQFIIFIPGTINRYLIEVTHMIWKKRRSKFLKILARIIRWPSWKLLTNLKWSITMTLKRTLQISMQTSKRINQRNSMT